MAWITGQRYLTYEESLNNANIIFKAMSGLGFSKEFICGILGNMWRESHVNPSLEEFSGGGGYGLTQLTPKQKLIYRLGVLNLSDNGDNQVKVLIKELTVGINGGNSSFEQWYDVGNYTYNKAKNSKDLDYCVEAFCFCYERAGEVAMAERKEYARKYYKDITGNVSGGGLQLAVLPIDTINVTQSEFTDIFSHQGTNAVDMVGTHSRYPLSAPCDVICVGVDRSEAFVVWQSQREVRCVDGTTSFITFNIGHDDTHYKINVGDKVNKGDRLGYTGNSGNSFGDHLHIEASKHKFTTVWQGGGLPNSDKLWKIFSSCDNVTNKKFPVINAGGIPWVCDINWKDGEGGGEEGNNDNKDKLKRNKNQFMLDELVKPIF